MHLQGARDIQGGGGPSSSGATVTIIAPKHTNTHAHAFTGST